MRALKSIVRWFFALQAVIPLLVPIAVIFRGITKHTRVNAPQVTSAHTSSATSGLLGYGLLAALFAVGALFAMAWWTTRKRDCARSTWAIAASCVNVLEGILILYASHLAVATRVRISPGSALWPIALGAAGIFLFSRSGAVSASSVSEVKRTSIAGDRTSPVVRHAVTAISFVAQGAAVVIWSRWAYLHHLFLIHGVRWLALITLASVLTTFIHECGHAVIAWCFQMGLISFKAGPFQWRKREGKWTFKFHAAGLLTPGGAVGAVPTDPAQPQWEEVLLIAAGPLANLILGFPTIYAVLHDYWASYQQTWEFVAFTGSFCLIGAILNLFPFMSEEGAYSDGARLLQILTKSPLDDYHRTMAGIAATMITPRRYRDLDIAAIERAASLFPNEFRGLHLNLCASHVFEDSNCLPEAAASLVSAEAIYNNFVVDLPGPIHTAFVIGHAYLNRDAAAARLWWNRMETKGISRKTVDYWLAKAALHWIESNSREAMEALREADAEAGKLPEFGAYEFDRDRCATLRQLFDKPVDGDAVSTSSPYRSPMPVPPPVAKLAVSVIAPKQVASAARPEEVNLVDVDGMSDALARILLPTARALPTEVTTSQSVEAQFTPSVVAQPPAAPAAEIAATAVTVIEAVPTSIATHSSDTVAPVVADITIVPERIIAASVAAPIVSPAKDVLSIPLTAALPDAVPTPVPSSATVAPVALPRTSPRPETPWEAPPASTPEPAAFMPAADDIARPAFTPAPTAAPARGPAVPAAFARRPRTVGPPLSDPLASPIVEDVSATPPVDLSSTATTLEASAPIDPMPETSVLPDPIIPPTLPVAQTQPAADNDRFDALAFIRAAAMENLST